MKISDIDQNLKVPETLELPDIRWLDARSEEFALYGTRVDEPGKPFRRLPADVAEKVNEGVAFLARNTAGLRLRFRTDSPYVAIHAEWDVQCCFSHMPVTGVSGFDLYRVRRGTDPCSGPLPEYAGTFTPPFNSPVGYESVVATPGGMQDFILNFPLYNDVDRLYVGVSESAKFEAPARYRHELPVVYYGSSITQGGCASRPGNAYQSMISRALDVDFINWGFSGSARGEETIAKHIAATPMSVFVCDYDHNAPDAAHLEATHFALYRTVRAANPDLPIVLLSKPDVRSICPEVYEANLRRRDIVRDTYERAVNTGDRHVYFIDGYSLFADDDPQSATVDGCHPNDLGFHYFRLALEPLLRKLLEA
ncbi:MAG: SGNH/GDSL hydrolase family protein [Clostridia bacterium]|nr:SGNH/GDSL hydrolase family protein [Clostridia bacterium]